MQQEQFGTQTPLYHKLHYNVRGQMYDMRLSRSSWASDEWNWNRGVLLNWYDSTSNFPYQNPNSGTNNPTSPELTDKVNQLAAAGAQVKHSC